MPVSFCVLGYVLAWFMLFPLWGVLQAGASLLVSSDAPNFNSNLTTTFDPSVAAAAAAAVSTGGTTAEAADAANPADGAPSTANDGSTVVTTTTTTTTSPWGAANNNIVIQGSSLEFPNSGEHYGQLYCDAIGLDAPVYWYDSDEILAIGVGQSLISLPPGYGTAIVLAGHNSTYFAPLQDAEVGQVIRFATNYGFFEYQISTIEVHNEDEFNTLVQEYCESDQERLVMYTCYPFEYTVGRKTERLVVTADKISGPIVVWRSVS